MPSMPRRSFSAFLALALLTLGLNILPAGAGDSAPGVERGVGVSQMLSGEAAIKALGPAISGVASAHGKSVRELVRAFKDDRGLAVSPLGKLLYRDAGTGALPAEPVGGTTGASGAPYPLENTFALHSLPGSKRTLYLDFDGQVLSGTAWNSDNGGADIVAPAWDIEGGTSVFTDAERQRIQGIWQRVAEDYAPFDVDVTTELVSEDRITRSSSSDDTYGMRVLISPISSYFGNYGGIAYVGVFDATGDYYKPALVFPEKLANAEKYIAEAAAHEAGHTFGLLHDGTTAGVEYYAGHGSGDTGWAPIMGSGYSKNLTQWSKGEYANANNTEDDLAVIQNNGGIYKADDHGDNAAAATLLAAGAQLTASGIVGRTGDVDMLSFLAGAGQVTFSAAPAPNAPDVDLLLELRDASGALLASGNPVDYLTSSVSAVVPGGTYYLAVTGTGKGDASTGYSSYGCLGAWSVSGSVVDPGVTTLAPVAIAAGTPATGEAPLPVVFDGAASYDPDGSLVSYTWAFGDGTVGSGASVAHTYTTAGSYAAVLTVADATGLTASSSVPVTVKAPNAAPNASFTASPVTGQAPLPVTFDGFQASDPDGTVVSWSWDFGDGSKGAGAATSHTYSSAGVYTARLTVTDDRGATGSSSAQINVIAAPAVVMRVTSIQLTVATVKGGKEATARVQVTDVNGRPVTGASVSGAWSGAVIGASAGTTDGNGVATIKSKRFKKGTVVFTVKSVSKSGYTYDPGLNSVTTASIAAGSSVTRYVR